MSSAEIRTMLGRWSRGARNGLGLDVPKTFQAAAEADTTTLVGAGPPDGSTCPGEAGDQAGNSTARITATRTQLLTILDTSPPPPSWFARAAIGPRYRV
jgi:hypothetical protein